MKKSLVFFLIMLMLSAVCIVPASALVMTDSYFRYEVSFATNEAVITKCLTDVSSIMVPSHYMDYKITGIKSYAFENNQNLESISLPTTIRVIDNYAFRNCRSLKYMTIPESVTVLGEGFCNGCSSLEKAYVNTAVSKLPAFSFAGCSSLDYVRLNPGISAIGQSAFSGCSSLQSIDLPENIKVIDRVAFYQSGLESFDINEGTDSVFDYTFAECMNLTRVNIPKSVTFIDSAAFKNDSNLTLGVWYGSVGYEYATANHIPYVLLDNVLLGDVNGDGAVNINDVTIIQRHVAELVFLEGIYLHAADVNQDGVTDISDATHLQAYLAEFSIENPVGEMMTK